jgi:predicted alpha/beta hydrolase family esterase
MTYFDGFPATAAAYAPIANRALTWAALQAYLDAGATRTAALAAEGLVERVDLDDPAREHGADWFIDTQGYIAERSDCIVLAFRGSEPKDGRDWITDFHFRPMEVMSGLSVHSGFWRALNQVWLDKIMPNIDLLRSKPLWITGHSLGGAIAVLAAMRLFRELPGGPTAQGVYTFGQPRASKLEFAAAYRASPLWDRTFRLINDEDVVSRVPPRVFKYCHVGHCGFYDAGHVLGLPPQRIEAIHPARATFVAYGDTLDGITNLDSLRVATTFGAAFAAGVAADDRLLPEFAHAATLALRSSALGRLDLALKAANPFGVVAAVVPKQASDHFGQNYLDHAITNMARNPF